MLLLAHYNFGKIKIKKEGVEKEMFVRTATIIANQGEKIVTLTDEIKKANESNKVLRDEKEYLELENSATNIFPHYHLRFLSYLLIYL